MQVAIGFGNFPSRWLINWHEIFKSLTKRSNCNRIITFDSHLKTALIRIRDAAKCQLLVKSPLEKWVIAG